MAPSQWRADRKVDLPSMLCFWSETEQFDLSTRLNGMVAATSSFRNRGAVRPFQNSFRVPLTAPHVQPHRAARLVG